ncbi:MAG: TadE/TadG family type IV pilus assembly protein, partial [Alphaproteobacteria bacterium]
MATAFRWQERGAAAVEFALIAVVLLVFMLGVIDVGRLLWVQHNLSSRSADALRFASLRGARS